MHGSGHGYTLLSRGFMRHEEHYAGAQQLLCAVFKKLPRQDIQTNISPTVPKMNGFSSQFVNQMKMWYPGNSD